MNIATTITDSYAAYDADLAALHAARDDWANTPNAERIAILSEIKDRLLTVADGWVETAARKKQLPKGSPLAGEEWLSGPLAVMSACNGLMQTLAQMEGKAFLDHLPQRETVSGQLAVQVMPHNIWDRLLLSGISAEVWMQPGVTADSLAQNTASAYDTPAGQRKGKVALVLGAGNIAAIAPLDCFQKLFLENQVVILKMNPVNDYLTDYLRVALKPLIDRDALRIVTGSGADGAYLTTHDLVEELHITGAGATHDAIVWGTGAEGAANKKAGTPLNTRRFTSELGAVCPTIVVPGPWSKGDIAFQAEHIATQKMHNSGFNCVACQVLVMPRSWDRSVALVVLVKVTSAASSLLDYFPGAGDRIDTFAGKSDHAERIDRGAAPACVITPADTSPDGYFASEEVFAPALSLHEIDETDPEAYLRAAVAYANDTLHGTLGGNILIHPKTIRRIGKTRFEEIVAEFRYGTIAINAWTGVGFLLSVCPWGAFPGHTLDDVQSGIGTVHNTFMFDKPERTVVTGPWRPFPRNLLSGAATLLPRPPWFVTNTRQHVVGRLLTRFQHTPGWIKLPRIFVNALRG